MRYAIIVGLVATSLCGREQVAAQERGIVAFKATIVKVHDKSLELSLSDAIPQGKSIRFEIADDARLEVVDFKRVDGKLTTTRKDIALRDLLPTQSINVIAIVEGDRPILLVGIVAGGTASGAEAIKLIADLGGAVRNFAWEKGDKRYDVNLSDSNISDDDLAVIASLDDLYVLDLSNTKITDKGIAHLANHPKLSEVKLSGTNVTNGVLAHLATIRHLVQVSVDQTKVTRQALIRFARTTDLQAFCQMSAGPKGEYRVYEQLRDDRGGTLPYVYLMKRTVYYGRFYPDETARRKPTTYYHRDGPVGAVLRRFDWFPQDGAIDFNSNARLPASVVGLSSMATGGVPMNAMACLWSEPAIGVVELNAGTIAAYGRPFQTIDFFNDLPELVPFNRKVDGNEPPIGFIEDALGRGSNIRVIDGPFKKSVRRGAPRGFYSAIFIDITVQQREDPKAVKKEDVHFDLLTQEAIRDLMDKTTPDGVLCYHTSHRTHEFYKPLSAAAAELGFAGKLVNDRFYVRDAKGTDADQSHFSSECFVIARIPEHLARFRSEKSKVRDLHWSVPPADEVPPWRDGVEPKMPIRAR